MRGLLGTRSGRLLPPVTENWQGGRLSFRLKVDPNAVNCVTARFNGSDVSPTRLILFAGDKQVGYRHLGDIEILDFDAEANGPGYPGRFYYVTTPLPVAVTKGKAEVDFEIRSTGRTWGYGDTFEKYQRAITEPSRGLYTIATHTDGFYAPAVDEKQGTAPNNPPIHATPGPEVLNTVRARVNNTVGKLLASTRHPEPDERPTSRTGRIVAG